MNTLKFILSDTTGNTAEFFTNEKIPMVTYKAAQYELRDAPKHINDALTNFLKANPDKAKAYKDIAGAGMEREQCVRCLFANLDGIPDFTNNGVLTPEYVDCPNRGKCKWEGIGCLARMPCRFGLSEREQEIADLADLTNDQIADRLYLSPFTVSTHLQNIQRKVGVRNKKQLIKIRPSIWRH